MIQKLITGIAATLLITSNLQGTAQTTKETTMPKGLWQAFNESRHGIEKEGQVFKAINHKNDYCILFEKEGVKLSATDAKNPWDVTMRLSTYGQETTLYPLPKATLHSKGTKITYQRGEIQEWYKNKAGGLEQGFTLNKPKHFDPSKKIQLTFALNSQLTPKQTKNAILFLDTEGKEKLRYDTLKAFDSNNKQLNATMTLTGTTLALNVDAKGASWPVIVDPVFTTQSKITGSNSSSNGFGTSVSLDGDTAVIGDYGDIDNRGDGSAYVFVRSGTSWSEQQKLSVSWNGAGFGISVSVEGDSIVVGASGADAGPASENGRCIRYQRSGTTWSVAGELMAWDGSRDDAFCYSVSQSKGTMVVGAYGDDDLGSKSGSAYIMSIERGEIEKITASDGAIRDWFGVSVSADGDTVVVGAIGDDDWTGAAYVFVYQNSGGLDPNWTQQAKLTPAYGASRFQFGNSVSVDGDTVVIGAESNSDLGYNAGAAYIFVRSGTTWTQQAKLTAADGAANDKFGSSVSVDGDTAVIAAYDAAYVFVRRGTTWSQQDKLTKTINPGIAYYAGSVSIDADTILVGANKADAAYIQRYECGFGSSVIAEQWHMVGIPCDLGSSNKVMDVFGDDVSGSYGTDWIVYRRSAAGAYVAVGSGEALTQNQGYWIKSLNDADWFAEGSATTLVQSTECASEKGCVEMPLTLAPDAGSTHQNLVGNPTSLNFDWTDVRIVVENDGFESVHTPADAEANNYVSKTINFYTGSSYAPCDGTTHGFEECRPQSHEGFWVKSLEGSASMSSMKLLIPYGDLK